MIEQAPHAAMYAIGAYFCDHYAELVEDVLADAEAIERVGLRAWADTERVGEADACEALITGLAIRFYAAVAGTAQSRHGSPVDHGRPSTVDRDR